MPPPVGHTVSRQRIVIPEHSALRRRDASATCHSSIDERDGLEDGPATAELLWIAMQE